MCHDSFTHVPWLIHMCVMTHSHTCYDCVAVCCSVLQCVAVLDPLTCLPCLILCHDSFVHVPSLIHFCRCSQNGSLWWTLLAKKVVCVAVCCSVLQCVAVCCSVLQCVAVCCSVLQCIAVCCSVLQCVAVCCSVLQCTAVYRSVSWQQMKKLSKNSYPIFNVKQLQSWLLRICTIGCDYAATSSHWEILKKQLATIFTI